MKQIRLIYTIAAWTIFGLVFSIYLSGLQPGIGFGNNGELIAASFKLQIGNSPGSPLYLLLGRIASLLAGEDTSRVAFFINSFSALASSFTILFLFWSIASIATKIMGEKDKFTIPEILVILGSATIGSLSFAFSDTFWTSAISGGINALSTLFIAIIFWSMLKWDRAANEKYANRWIVLIAYLTGLSAGVHMLNLLAYPSIILIYYFRTYKTSFKGVALSLLVSGLGIVLAKFLISPGVLSMAGFFERFFVNGLSLPYNSGFIFFIILLISGLSFGIIISHNKGKVIINNVLVLFTALFLGYSSYATLIIRSNANPPIDQENPENAFSLQTYLNKNKFNVRPLFYGQSFNAPITDTVRKHAVFAPLENKYIISKYVNKYKYESKFTSFFPRMWSSDKQQIDAYITWANINIEDIYYPLINSDSSLVKDQADNIVYNTNDAKAKPSFGKNLSYFVSYQLNHMYFRYLMWNFSGKQNNIISHYKGEINKGNWITGVNPIDSQRLGSFKYLPDSYRENKSRNSYFLIPFILGLIGFFYLLKFHPKSFWVLLSLFFFTGIGLLLFINQQPLQLTETDHLFAGSFYAFTIWIGLSVVALYKISSNEASINAKSLHIKTILAVALAFSADILINHSLSISLVVLFAVILIYFYSGFAHFLRLKVKSTWIPAVLILLLTFISPALLLTSNLDDHNRSKNYIANNWASNYLNSCEEDAILFADNSTGIYPLLYKQEVEGFRTDVRLVNTNYMIGSWYLEKMQASNYSSSPIKFSLSPEKYLYNRRDTVFLIERVNRPIKLKEALNFVAHDEDDYKSIMGINRLLEYIPQKRFTLKSEKETVSANNTLKPSIAKKFVPQIEFSISKDFITKDHLMMLDLIETNQWNRPIYFATKTDTTNYLGLGNYFEMAGLTYRLVPAHLKDGFSEFGGINSELMYDRLMNVFQYPDLAESLGPLDTKTIEILTEQRRVFNYTAAKLLSEKQKTKAIEILDKNQNLVPDSILAYDQNMLVMVLAYYKAGKKDKALLALEIVHENTLQKLEYYNSLKSRFKGYLDDEKQQDLNTLNEMKEIAKEIGEIELSFKYSNELSTFGANSPIN